MRAHHQNPIVRTLSNFYVRLGLLGIIIVGGALYIGRLDSGEINIAQTLEEVRASGNNAGAADNVAATPGALRNMPNGGLVPQGANAEPAPAPEVTETPAEEEASTTPPETP